MTNHQSKADILTIKLAISCETSRFNSKNRTTRNPLSLFKAYHCFLGWIVVWNRTQQAIQDMMDEAPRTKSHYSDAFDAYNRHWYRFGRYEVTQGKTETYSVEGGNAELHHYLARLVRKSHYFSRCPYALNCAIRLFIYCYNNRQFYKQRFPSYPAHVMEFVCPPI